MSSSARRSEGAAVSNRQTIRWGEMIFSYAQCSHSADTSEAQI